MKRAVTIASLLIAVALPAAAHEGAGGNVGIGVGIGSPTALSIEIAPVPWSAFELALGMPSLDENNVYAHLVYDVDIVRLADGPSAIVPIYVGVGGFVHDHAVTDWGARVPLGLSVNFRRTPLQLFAEAALQAVLITDGNTHPVDIGGFGGARVWF